MTDTPSTIRLGDLAADATEPSEERQFIDHPRLAPVAVDPVAAEIAELRAMVTRLLESHLAALQREQARLERHAAERSTLTERLLLLEEQVSALVVAEYRR